MKFASLASSSSGNCSVVFDDNFKILIDCGVSKRFLKNSLDRLNIELKDIDALIITHCHNDHFNFSSFKAIVDNNVPVFCSNESEEIIKKAFETNKEGINFERRQITKSFVVKNCLINSIKVKHDSKGGNYGLTFESDYRSKIKKISYATDLGNYNSELAQEFLNSSLIFIESNHDMQMLEESDIPDFLKERIGGEYGHLSNDQCSNFLNDILSFSRELPEHIILAHLSKDRNTPEKAVKAAKNATKHFKKNIRVTPANKNEMTGIFEI